MVDLDNYLLASSSIGNIHLVEEFVEQICDRYHINNVYFGHIMYTTTELFTLAAMIDNQHPENIRISFSSDKKGLKFNFYFGERYLDMAAGLKVPEEKWLTNEEISEKQQGFLAIGLLSDEINLLDDDQAVQVVFYIDSINKRETDRRIRNLEEYYENLLQPKKVM